MAGKAGREGTKRRSLVSLSLILTEERKEKQGEWEEGRKKAWQNDGLSSLILLLPKLFSGQVNENMPPCLSAAPSFNNSIKYLCGIIVTTTSKWKCINSMAYQWRGSLLVKIIRQWKWRKKEKEGRRRRKRKKTRQSIMAKEGDAATISMYSENIGKADNIISAWRSALIWRKTWTAARSVGIFRGGIRAYSALLLRDAISGIYRTPHAARARCQRVSSRAFSRAAQMSSLKALRLSICGVAWHGAPACSSWSAGLWHCLRAPAARSDISSLSLKSPCSRARARDAHIKQRGVLHIPHIF